MNYTYVLTVTTSCVFCTDIPQNSRRWNNVQILNFLRLRREKILQSKDKSLDFIVTLVQKYSHVIKAEITTTFYRTSEQ